MATPTKIIGYYKREDGWLLSVILRLQNPEEIEMYRSFLESEILVCPKCGRSHVPAEFNPDIGIDNPLGDSFLLMGEPVCLCTNCETPIRLSMLEYSAFPSVIAFVNSLKSKYLAKKAGKNG